MPQSIYTYTLSHMHSLLYTPYTFWIHEMSSWVPGSQRFSKIDFFSLQVPVFRVCIKSMKPEATIFQQYPVMVLREFLGGPQRFQSPNLLMTWSTAQLLNISRKVSPTWSNWSRPSENVGPTGSCFGDQGCWFRLRSPRPWIPPQLFLRR